MIISHLTTCHKFDDHRIFYKHASLQTSLGYKVKVFAYHSSPESTFEKHEVTIQLFRSKSLYQNFKGLYAHKDC